MERDAGGGAHAQRRAGGGGSFRRRRHTSPAPGRGARHNRPLCEPARARQRSPHRASLASEWGEFAQRAVMLNRSGRREPTRAIYPGQATPVLTRCRRSQDASRSPARNLRLAKRDRREARKLRDGRHRRPPVLACSRGVHRALGRSIMLGASMRRRSAAGRLRHVRCNTVGLGHGDRVIAAPRPLGRAPERSPRRPGASARPPDHRSPARGNRPTAHASRNCASAQASASPRSICRCTGRGGVVMGPGPRRGPAGAPAPPARAAQAVQRLDDRAAPGASRRGSP